MFFGFTCAVGWSCSTFILIAVFCSKTESSLFLHIIAQPLVLFVTHLKSLYLPKIITVFSFPQRSKVPPVINPSPPAWALPLDPILFHNRLTFNHLAPKEAHGGCRSSQAGLGFPRPLNWGCGSKVLQSPAGREALANSLGPFMKPPKVSFCSCDTRRERTSWLVWSEDGQPEGPCLHTWQGVSGPSPASMVIPSKSSFCEEFPGTGTSRDSYCTAGWRLSFPCALWLAHQQNLQPHFQNTQRLTILYCLLHISPAQAGTLLQ